MKAPPFYMPKKEFSPLVFIVLVVTGIAIASWIIFAEPKPEGCVTVNTRNGIECVEYSK